MSKVGSSPRGFPTKTPPGGVTKETGPFFLCMSSPAPSPQAWRDCYRQLAPKLLLFARQWLSSPADAEDVVQTAFVRFWQKQPDAAPEHYPLLYAAVRTAALDFLRSSDRRSK